MTRFVYFIGLNKEAVDAALFDWQNSDLNMQDYIKTIPSAGSPRNHFILYNEELAPLKAILKHAMRTGGIDPASPERSAFTSHNGRDWLESLGFKTVYLEEYDEGSLDEYSRSRKLYSVLSRPNQAEFRNRVIKLYSGACAITGCRSLGALEAAHIQSVADGGSDGQHNGILLRADLHRLFDQNFIALNPNCSELYVSKIVKEDYFSFHGKFISLPTDGPGIETFTKRWHSRFR